MQRKHPPHLLKHGVQMVTGSRMRMLNKGDRKNLAGRIKAGRKNPEVNAYYKANVKHFAKGVWK